MERSHRTRKSYFKIGLIVNKYTICAALASTCFYGGCSQANKFLGLEDDNFIESALEDVIEKETGVRTDLTPDSPEPEDVHPCCRSES